MAAVILANGEIPSFELAHQYCEGADLIICSDGALQFALQYDIKPDILVGDMDSLTDYDENRIKSLGIEIYKYPSEKDKTDTEIAMDLALQKGHTEIIFLGATGKRLDHTLGNLQLLYQTACRHINARIIDEHTEICMAQGNFTFTGRKNAVLSLIPYTDDVFIESTSGLYYPIVHQYLPKDKPYAVSNVLTDDHVRIQITKGTALLLYNRLL